MNASEYLKIKFDVMDNEFLFNRLGSEVPLHEVIIWIDEFAAEKIKEVGKKDAQ